LRANRLALTALLIIIFLVSATPVSAQTDESSQDWWSSLWGSITNALSGAGQWINENIVQPVSNAVSGAVETVKNWFSGVTETVSNAVSDAVSNLPETISRLPETVNNAISGASQWIGQNVAKPISDSFDEISRWIKENIVESGGKMLQDFTQGVQDALSGVAQGASQAWEDFSRGVEETVNNVSRYFENLLNVSQAGTPSEPTGEGGMDGVDDISDLDLPTLWLGWDINIPVPWPPFSFQWKVGVDLMAPFESLINKASEYTFEIFFKNPVRLLWEMWKGTYNVCKGLGLAAPLALAAAMGTEIGVGVVLVMILQKLVDIIL